MDDIVLRAMQKWPDVPNVFGWLRLDRRGNWLVKSRSGEFGRIGNAAVCDFMGRNYAPDERGRWYFQNGPQRVFVTPDYTPLVYRLDENGAALVAHTGRAARRILALHLDEAGALIAECETGAGVLLDRDLPAFLDRLIADNPGLDGVEALLAAAAQGVPVRLRGQAPTARLCCIESAAVPRRFGFDPKPAPEPGQPDC